MTAERKIGDVVVEWHKETFGRDDGVARAARARLRRCKSPAEALLVAETHNLNRRLRDIGQNPGPDRLTLLSIVFSHLHEVRGKKLAAQFGEMSTRDSPRKLSETRFQSLIRNRTHRGLVVPLRRCLGVLGKDLKCDGYRLATDLYFWNDKTRNDWCFQYFGINFMNSIETENTQ